ncbi:paraquat-inducible protein B [Malonomonas rubra DSM 5091]|uniref:Paraquat-inducible protein B n=1 Tax=Malonomonas rubra DSM 5091 TaxID=1122189 RepID=A0A1M6LFC4_MALRU|nr:MlaD family protein [Malonomonas rubra]SHJ69894.1 paraquat-inducible protein B [Malonomonas rubra DSM 5091]
MQRRKRIDPRVIGSFVVGAILLGMAGLIFFGPGGLVSETEMYVLHFDSSVKGLTVGSPVRFRGVKIGQVKDINVRLRPSDLEFHIPVIIEIEPSRIKAEGSEQGFIDAMKATLKGGNPIDRLVEKGLRGQLQLDSLVTGRLYVNFDMYPDEPVYNVDYPSEYPPLPTISSSLGELTKTFEDLPLRELADKLIRSADGFERLVTSPSLHSGLAKFDELATNMNELLEEMKKDLSGITAELSATMQQTQKTLSNIDDKLGPASSELSDTLQAFAAASKKTEQTMQAFAAASQQTEQAMQSIEQMTSADSQLQQQLSQTLQELSRTARSVRYLANELEHDPQILLRGRSTGEKK